MTDAPTSVPFADDKGMACAAGGVCTYAIAARSRRGGKNMEIDGHDTDNLPTTSLLVWPNTNAPLTSLSSNGVIDRATNLPVQPVAA